MVMITMLERNETFVGGEMGGEEALMMEKGRAMGVGKWMEKYKWQQHFIKKRESCR